MGLHSVLLVLALSWCCSAAEPPGPPTMRLNSDLIPNQSDVALTVGSAFILSCHGNGSVRWSSTAFRLLYLDKLMALLDIRWAEPRHTGTYRCGYTNGSLEHLSSWIHLYITDRADSSTVFVTPRTIPNPMEGEDFLFRCLLTDPSVTNLTLQSEDRGRGLPVGMNVTFDPRRGAMIGHLKKSFRGRYACSGWKDGREYRSKPVDLLVVSRLRHPPALSVSKVEFVRLEGERLEVTCRTSNPSHFYSVAWTHPHIQNLNVTVSRHYGNNRLYLNSTLTVSAVRRTHGGPYTCTATNEAGVATATAHLRVLDHPYLRIYLYLQSSNANTVEAFANISSVPVELKEELAANISSRSHEEELIANVTTVGTDLNGASSANISGSNRVEVREGADVTLTFVMEAYPPIREQHWTTPTNINNDDSTVYQESYADNSYRSEASLLLRRIRQQDKGRYSLRLSNSFFNGSQDVDLRIFHPPSASITQQNATLTCSSAGYPPPSVLWVTCPGVQHSCADTPASQVSPAVVTSQEMEEVRSHLPLSADDDDVTVECVASNLVGTSRGVFVHRSRLHPMFTPALIGALSAAAVLLLLLLVIFYKYRQKPKYEIRWKIIESTDGNNYTFIDPTQLPYNHKWEFPRDKLRLGAVLGSGAFGKVVEAKAFGLGTGNKATRVAVKMLKPSAHSEEREALMSELKILSHLGYHDNIVNLLGACTQGGPMLMITEYCSHGDLLNFLRAHAQDFVASMLSVDSMEANYKNVASQHARLRSDSGISCCSEYQEMQPVLSPGQSPPGGLTDSLSVCDLMRFSYQVAQGLDFLSTRNCIHRDVAARNVLLTDGRVAKICDFGLARDIRNDDSYIVQGNARLPVKWMAPESIFQCIYTVQSDVWSYGVLLWEIFSLGKSPYPNVAVDTNFYKMIKDGRHMEQPDFAPAEMYYLMTLCWTLEPTHRPTFKTIAQLINRLLLSTNDTSARHSDQQLYKNINECREQEEEEEVRGETLKTEEEEEEEQDRHDSSEGGEEREPMMKNIYQLS
ncbi:macrophage colony-stimulating factor 1 receptor 2-like isoform X1 [Odontesthes bonariensis]|uniref:macrophage colony-stimulating factor 1 receptor 2-like isoform X1 n=1 Tax=Odontesthes bonariensis TaxID=219752 RepID=UPI003F589CEF